MKASVRPSVNEVDADSDADNEEVTGDMAHEDCERLGLPKEDVVKRKVKVEERGRKERMVEGLGHRCSGNLEQRW